MCHAGRGLDIQRVAVTLTGLADDSISQGVQNCSSDDDTLSDDRKRELVTGRALRLIGDNLQRCPGQRFLGHPREKVEQFALEK